MAQAQAEQLETAVLIILMRKLPPLMGQLKAQRIFYPHITGHGQIQPLSHYRLHSKFLLSVH